ncbi:FAD-dependent 5-carboxymethylaminomethyl-2-thiouridine(34) oxidoreductase MnmC [Leptospira harrisiae]|uniref:FAD-dependent 5-carboxymethylaminomethyl-2-thiouridine(34) oxidoreductase MnmC n=1 Tax=Leptospira harrisiae TaxID=2023189 RepID=A0A2N0AM15_9LEPT|nr:FAD-dependent 5-carboxymethylaminomethyl-2-thiouridine(34) oxidoreductase MnmC [Leptospira harrisiae]PJZ85339.1 FAD-dependent 5-carboxymethylaminomethyl-2-thiouridine(34) oxidoreductase MnmC [Leptospira harrisiae]PKA08873.1 FAD-dependent 5-carboxymethylaminomethyl-2-thiouridine(34) oxidoreductase MnmC [Leptospira harrisiae]
MNNETKIAVVVGAGISGASICFALKKRNIQTILIDSELGPARHASGNPIGVIYPFLTKHKLAESEFSLAAFQYFLSVWDEFHLKSFVPHVDGIYFLMDSEEAYDRYSNALKSHQIPTHVANEKLEPFSGLPAIFFPYGKSVSPVDLTKQILTISNPETKYSCKLLSWEELESDSKIICQTSVGEIQCDYLFLSQGFQFARDPRSNWLPLKKVRGQILKFPEQNPTNAHGILYGDYITSAINGYQVLGATFDEFKLEENPRPEESILLWEKLTSKLPKLSEKWGQQNPSLFPTRVSYRTQSQDRHPIAGKLPNISKLDLTVKYQNLLKVGKKHMEIPYYESVGILNGLGSRGLTHALYAAEILVSSIFEGQNITSESIFKSLKPDRFLLRMWKREQLT